MEVSAAERSENGTAQKASSGKSGLGALFDHFVEAAAKHLDISRVAPGLSRMATKTVDSQMAAHSEREAQEELAARPERPELPDRPQRLDAPERAEPPRHTETGDPDRNNAAAEHDRSKGEDASSAMGDNRDIRNDHAKPDHDRSAESLEQGSDMVAANAEGEAAKIVLPQLAGGIQFQGQIGELASSVNKAATQAANNATHVSTVAAQASETADAALRALQHTAVKANAGANKQGKAAGAATAAATDTESPATTRNGLAGLAGRVTVTTETPQSVSRPMNTLSPGAELAQNLDGEIPVDPRLRPENGKAGGGASQNGNAKTQATTAPMTMANPSNENENAGAANASLRAATVSAANSAASGNSASNRSQGASGDVQQVQSVAQAGGQEQRVAANAKAHETAQTHRSTPNAPNIPDQIAVNIKKAIGDGVDKITIQLKPGNLGRVEVKLEVGHDGRVIVVVSAEKSETLEALQRDARGLERALQEAGLKTNAGDLSFNLRGENPDGEDASDKNGAPGNLADDGAGHDDTPIPVTAGVIADMVADDGHVDIRI